MAIKKCSCENKWQDKKYGKGMRVCNETAGGSGAKQYRCTVCKTVHS